MQRDAAREFAGDATESHAAFRPVLLHGWPSLLQRGSDRETILTVKVIYFTEGATNPIEDFEARGVRYVPLASAAGEVGASVVSCFHFSAGARITETPCVHDCVLLVVQGRLTLWGIDDPQRIHLFPARIDMSGGMGVVLNAGEPMRIESDEGAISTLTLTEKDGKTVLVFSELYPTKEAADRACEGMEDGMPEQFAQLDELLVVLGPEGD